MEDQYEEISRWKDWSLEDTCLILGQKFPKAAIWIVRPSNMLRYLFSCFHNFVKSSIIGIPEYSSNHGSIEHLYYLLMSAFKRVCHERAKAKATTISKEELSVLPVTLIGFSKGCVVLNQILHELGNYSTTKWKLRGTPSPDHQQVNAFLNQIKAIYWLDAGHSGESQAWVTEDRLLDHLAELCVDIHVHVTPHQVCCPNRPMFGEEEKIFVSKLKQKGVNVVEQLHFGKEERSLLYHFKLLNVF